MTATLEIERSAREAGLSPEFVPTGQTGVIIAGWGICVDAVVSDFVAGASEQLVRQVQLLLCQQPLGLQQHRYDVGGIGPVVGQQGPGPLAGTFPLGRPLRAEVRSRLRRASMAGAAARGPETDVGIPPGGVSETGFGALPAEHLDEFPVQVHDAGTAGRRSCLDGVVRTVPRSTPHSRGGRAPGGSHSGIGGGVPGVLGARRWIWNG